jgi:hypothetical protein
VSLLRKALVCTALAACCAATVRAQQQAPPLISAQDRYRMAKAEQSRAAARRAEQSQAPHELAQPIPARPGAPLPDAPEGEDAHTADLTGNATAHDLDLLRDRYRPALHEGDPLRLVGSDDEGNELRARTHALAKGLHEPQLVDQEELYQRALAMYGDGERFQAPLPAAEGAEPPRIEPRRRRVVPPLPQAQAEEHRIRFVTWSVIAGMLASIGLLVWFLARVRPALVAPRAPEQPAPEAQTFVWNPSRLTREQAAMRAQALARAQAAAQAQEPRAPLPQAAPAAARAPERRTRK